MKLSSTFFNHDAQAGGFYPKSHTGIDIAEFVNKQNILIEGIRGTGKTHILKMVEKHCLDTFKEKRVLPVFVSLAQINEHARKDPNEFRLHLHTHIVRRCIETVETHKGFLHTDSGIFVKAFNKTKMLFGFSEHLDDFDKLTKQIKEISEYLMYKLQFDLTSENFRGLSGIKVDDKEKVSTQASLKSPIGLSGKATYDETQNISHESIHEKTLMYVGSKLAHHDASGFIVEFFRQIQILLNLDYILLLLDECSEASDSSQVEIFRLFKAIRGANSAKSAQENLAFFIGCVYPHGETYYPNRNADGFSFDPGQDCAMQFLQWDEIDIDTYVNFFQDMTYLRAQEILEYSGSFEQLQNLIFENRNSFLLAAYCANGIPRRFWQILKQAYDPSGKITVNSIDNVIHEITNNQILTLGNLTEQDLDFMDYIVDILSNKNVDIRRKSASSNKIPQNIYFSLSRKVTKAVSRLVMQGAIHNKSRMRTKRRRAVQPMYSIDISVAYTFRIIPPKNLVNVVTCDIPKCSKNNFDLAPEIKSRGLANIYDGIDESDLFDPTNDGFPEGRGIVQSYSEGNYGYIDAFDGGSSLFFWSNQVPEKNRKLLKKGDQVKFFIKETKHGGRQAIQIEIMRSGTGGSCNDDRIIGEITSFVPGKYGFINLSDGGPDAFFHSSILNNSQESDLKKGDRVSCKLFENERGRNCSEITLISANDNTSFS